MWGGVLQQHPVSHDYHCRVCQGRRYVCLCVCVYVCERERAYLCPSWGRVRSPCPTPLRTDSSTRCTWSSCWAGRRCRSGLSPSANKGPGRCPVLCALYRYTHTHTHAHTHTHSSLVGRFKTKKSHLKKTKQKKDMAQSQKVLNICPKIKMKSNITTFGATN